ncbi:ethylene-responsive transcription factor [Melia azedarach]|uniref:Ethylene-responsive transcription factor n=1 Tax=Melia azedarach TaxID=155640 RepID=A0ACC1YFL9_MELAZ|nr:ethylene-responsive transcription factor [Melia azedarach]
MLLKLETLQLKKGIGLAHLILLMKPALAYDRAALSMKGAQARTNFIYTDNGSFHSLLTPFDIQALLPPSQFSNNTTSQNKQSTVFHSSQPQPDISESKSSITSNNETSNETPYDSLDDTGFFFSSTDSNSGYLGCIVPDNCLNPPSNQTSTTNTKFTKSAASNDQNFGLMNANSFQNQSHCSSYTLPLDTTSMPTDPSIPYFGEFNPGFWGDHQQSWELNSDELSTMMNNPGMVENGCMGALYPVMDNPSYGLVSEATSSTTCSPSVPSFGDVVDFGYSLF